MYAQIRRITLITRKNKQHTLTHMQQAHKYVRHTHTHTHTHTHIPIHKHESHTNAYFLCAGELSREVVHAVWQ